MNCDIRQPTFNQNSPYIFILILHKHLKFQPEFDLGTQGRINIEYQVKNVGRTNENLSESFLIDFFWVINIRLLWQIQHKSNPNPMSRLSESDVETTPNRPQLPAPGTQASFHMGPSWARLGPIWECCLGTEHSESEHL